MWESQDPNSYDFIKVFSHSHICLPSMTTIPAPVNHDAVLPPPVATYLDIPHPLAYSQYEPRSNGSIHCPPPPLALKCISTFHATTSRMLKHVLDCLSISTSDMPCSAFVAANSTIFDSSPFLSTGFNWGPLTHSVSAARFRRHKKLHLLSSTPLPSDTALRR